MYSFVYEYTSADLNIVTSAHRGGSVARGNRLPLIRSWPIRYLRVAASNPRAQHVGRHPTGAPAKDCKTIFVKNLPYDTSEDAVR